MGLGTGIVNVGHIGDGGDFGTGAMAQGMNDFSQRRKDNNLQALGLAKEKKDGLKKRYINNAVSNVLGMKPAETKAAVAAIGKEGEEGYVPAQAAVMQTPDEYSMSVKQKMGEIHDIDPMVALGLSQKITQPYREQSNADRLFGLQTDTLEEKVTQNKHSNQRDTVTNPNTGKTFSYNPKSGKYDKEVFTGTSGNDANIKGNRTVAVPSRDGLGNESTKHVLQFIRDANGNVIVNPELNSGVKKPKLTQKDIGFVDEYLSNRTDLTNMTGIVNDPNSEDIFGVTEPIQNWLAKTFDTETGKKAADFDSIRAKLMTGLTGQLSGALSDKDMAYIENQMPSQQFSRDQNIIRMNNINERVGMRQASSLKRLRTSNPEAVKEIYSKMADDESSVPYGYKLQSNGSEYRLVKK